MLDQIKRLAHHSAIYGLGGIVSRILAVFLLPLYTAYLDPSDLGKGGVLIAFSSVMGLSRTYLGAHWLSDAVAGVLLGTTIALGSALVTHRIRERRTSSVDVTPLE